MLRRLVVPAVAGALLLPLLQASQAATAGLAGQPGNGTATGPVSSHHAQPGQAPGLPDLDVIDPVRYRLSDAVVEHVQVRSRDGINRIWVDIIRPRTKPGVRVPTVMDMSPYFNTLGRGWVGNCKTPTSPGLSSTLSALCSGFEDFPEFYDDYFVPRGYAVALMDLRGTRNTSGCQVYGDRVEVEDGVDVVDWIADQPWSNGKVGLTGGSYDGTMANGVAVEQPLIGRHKNAVPAVVPIRAIDRWYDYHFLNGVPSASHEATPALFTAALAADDLQTQSPADDPLVVAEIAERKACIATAGALTDVGYAPVYQDSTNDHWTRRDFVRHARTTKAAFFFIHGLYDFNVKTNNVAHMWAALPQSAPKRMWLLDGDHVDPDMPSAAYAEKHGYVLPHTFQRAYREGVHRWWAQYLKGLPAGADRAPTVEVQQQDGSWLGSRRWPVPATDRVLRLNAGGRLGTSRAEGSVSYADGASGAPASAVFTTAPAGAATRIAGQIQLDVDYTLTGPDTAFTVQVDDLPPGTPVDAEVTDSTLDEVSKGAFTVTYAFARAAYASEIKGRGISYPTLPQPVTPGTAQHISFPSLPMDFVLRPGHRLRFTFGTQLGGTEMSQTGGTVQLRLGSSKVRLPVAR